MIIIRKVRKVLFLFAFFYSLQYIFPLLDIEKELVFCYYINIGDSMNNKKTALIFIVIVAMVILIISGATFAWFSALISSENNAVNLSSATLDISLVEDLSLIKGRVIPSAEEYVDIASKYRNESGEIDKNKYCIDDNGYEICSVYKFTVINNSLDNPVPLYFTLKPNINNFTYLYFKVLDSDFNEVMGKTHLDNIEGKTEEEINSIVLTPLNKVLEASTSITDPSFVTYYIVMWVDEINENQTELDSGRTFASTLFVEAGTDGKGVTGMMVANGTE